MDKVFTEPGVDWKRQKKFAEIWQAKGRYFSMERKKENNMPISYLFSCRFGYLYIKFFLKFLCTLPWQDYTCQVGRSPVYKSMV
jgi:hypothetical protein